MTDIFQEVEEDVRRDELARIWRSYGPYIVAAAVGVVIAVGAISAWRSYDAKRQLERSRVYLQSLNLALREPGAAASSLAAIAEKGGGYGILARFREASARADSGNQKAALAIYEKLAADSSLDPLLRDLARLRAVYLEVDSAALNEVTDKLAPLIAADNPWRYSARELQGFVEMRAGAVPAAQASFRVLATDPGTPDGIRGRANDMLLSLGGSTQSGGAAAAPDTKGPAAAGAPGGTNGQGSGGK